MLYRRRTSSQNIPQRSVRIKSAFEWENHTFRDSISRAWWEWYYATYHARDIAQRTFPHLINVTYKTYELYYTNESRL